MSGIIGKKIGMTSLFDEQGRNLACTVIEAEPCAVTQIRTKEKDGYEAVQLGWGLAKDKHTSRPLAGHFAKAGVAPRKKLVEFRGFTSTPSLGSEINVTQFAAGDTIDVIGYSKGKGFQGVVKRHGFSGVGGTTHGQHNRARHPGSIGACSFPSRVFKGLRMAGRTGNRRVKVQNLRVVKVMAEHNLLVISGSIPGPKNAVVIIEKY